MRILLAAKTMGVGGLERIVVSLARELRGRHHEVWVVSSGGNLVADLRRFGTPHVYAPLEATFRLVARLARASAPDRRSPFDRCIRFRPPLGGHHSGSARAGHGNTPAR